MKACAICGKQWDTTASQCPDDGGALIVATEMLPALGAVAVASGSDRSRPRSGAQPKAVVVEAPEANAAANDDLAVGMKVGEYVIERKIGVGGMGVVYGARHPVIGKRTAIKVLNAKLSVDREAVSRFVLEAQSVNQIGHANIVDIFSFGTLEDGRSYFAMEWLQGETLGERLERLGKLPLGDAVKILSTLCRALEAAHAAGVIHRDLKPDNVFLATDDDGWRVKLLDFGIAKLQTASPTVSKTATGMVVGTPLFMAPEQAKGEAVDSRTDVYALGLLAYTVVCGTSMFEDETSAIEVLAAHITKAPVPPRSLVPELPAAFETLILEMVAKHPSFRPTLVEVRQQLAAIGAALPAGAPVSSAVEPRRTMRAVASEPSLRTAPAEPVGAVNTGLGGIDHADDDVLGTRRRSRWPLIAGVAAAVAVAITVVVAVTHSSGGARRPSDPAAGAAMATTATPATATATVAAITPATIANDAAVAVAIDAGRAIDAAIIQGTADLAIAPVDARVTIDGKPAIVEGGHAHATLPPGDHAVVVTAHGRSARAQIAIAADHTTTATIAVPSATTATIKRPPTGPTKPPTGDDVDGVQNPFSKNQ